MPEKERERERERERRRVELCKGQRKWDPRKRRRYNVINLFMQYNLAHSNYNSAKFNWIVYRRRSLAARYRNKCLPKPPRPNPLHSSSFFSFASSFLPSFLPSFLVRPCAGCYRKTKENSIDFPRACGRLLLLNSPRRGGGGTRASFTFHRGPPQGCYASASDFIISQ